MSITDCNLFSSLSENEANDLLREVSAKEAVFDKGDILAHQGEACNRLIILIEGSIMAEMTDPSGKVVKVEDVYAPNPLAILFLFGRNNKFPVQATAREKVKALIIPKQSVLKMLSMNENLLKNYLDISANYASMLSMKLHFMSFRTIRQKLAMYILGLSTDNGKTVKLDRSQTALSEYFGVSRPSLARELRNMHNEGLIVFSRNEIEIIDPNKLKFIVNF